MSPLALPLRERRLARPVPVALLATTALGLLVRFHRLGARVSYYDEAWFGYWTLQFVETGAWEYRPVLHGPFFARVNAMVLPAVGASDAAARAVVALVGGLLPLSAWLFRERLRDAEVVALGIALAFTPVLLYYSRFMRKDVPLAAFMLVSLGLLVRTGDTGRARYLYAAGATLGLAFTTKESVLLWLLAWLGAGLLLLDRRLLRARDRQGDARSAARGFVRQAGACLRAWWAHGVLAGALALVVVVYFYAPRSPDAGEVGLWRALGGEFEALPAVVFESTVGSFRRAVDWWAAGSIQDHAYLPYLADTLLTLAAGALAVSMLSVVGFLADRYAGEAPRDLVAFNFYVGAAAVVGYPLANAFPVPWSTVHAVVPLSIPAAVGAVAVYRWGRAGFAAARSPDGRRLRGATRAAVAGLLLAALVVSAGLTAVETSYRRPHESPAGPDGGSELVYYAQAPGELREVAGAIERAAAESGPRRDVVYVGENLAMNESHATRPQPGAWFARMPLPWYTEAYGADVTSVKSPSALRGPRPPVVIASPEVAHRVSRKLTEGYTSAEYALDDAGDRSVVVFVRNGTRGVTRAATSGR